MTNEIIGIAIVLALTFLLFALRHFIQPSKRSKTPRTIRIAHREKEELSREDSMHTVWPLRPPDFETPEHGSRPKRESGNEIEGQGLRPA